MKTRAEDYPTAAELSVTLATPVLGWQGVRWLSDKPAYVGLRPGTEGGRRHRPDYAHKRPPVSRPRSDGRQRQRRRGSRGIALDCSMSAFYNRPMFSSQYPFACVRKCTVTDFVWCG